MALKEPISIEECIYFTKREIGKGHIKAWVYRGNCPKCKEGTMGKPKDKKTGRPMIRSKEYQCLKCGYSVDSSEYELSLNVEVKYTCPYCFNTSEIVIPFKRKKIKIFDEELQKEVSADAIVFPCQKCSKRIEITKKMK